MLIFPKTKLSINYKELVLKIIFLPLIINIKITMTATNFTKRFFYNILLHKILFCHN